VKAKRAIRQSVRIRDGWIDLISIGTGGYRRGPKQESRGRIYAGGALSLIPRNGGSESPQRAKKRIMYRREKLLMKSFGAT